MEKRSKDSKVSKAWWEYAADIAAEAWDAPVPPTPEVRELTVEEEARMRRRDEMMCAYYGEDY